MTNPLPESAVELAAREMHRVDWPSMDWNRLAETTRNNYRKMARAALPAIREAVVGEFAGLVEKWRGQASRHRDCGPNGAMLAEIRDRCADELAALTEQENRNG